MEFPTQKGSAIATTYYFDKTKKWYIGAHHIYDDPHTGETKIGKGFSIEIDYATDLLNALVLAVNNATGSKFKLEEE